MIMKLDLENRAIVNQILELQKASYLIEADIIGFYDIPTLKDTADSIQQCGETFYGLYSKEQLAGIIAYKICDEVLDIHRVAVHPKYFRMGIAQMLLQYIEKVEDAVTCIVVCTGKENKPAVNLYVKNGFTKVKDIDIGQGIYLTEFTKAKNNNM